jgi:hypothetical protein
MRAASGPAPDSLLMAGERWKLPWRTICRSPATNSSRMLSFRFLLPQVHTAGFSKEEVEVILSLIDRDDVITHWLTASTNGAVRLKLGEILHKILSSESGHSSHDRCQRSRCCAF